MKRTIASSLFSLAALLSLPTLAQAEVTVTDPWVRATVPGQQATGAFMVLAGAMLGGVFPGGMSEEEARDAISVNFGSDKNGAMETIRDGIAHGRDRPRYAPPPRINAAICSA